MDVKDLPVFYQEISVRDVYGPNEPHIPAGYICIAFRKPEPTDIFWGTDGGINTGTNGGSRDPRIILEKIKRHVVTFTATGEHRTPKRGEFVRWPRFTDFYECLGSGIYGTFDIYERTETEI